MAHRQPEVSLSNTPNVNPTARALLAGALLPGKSPLSVLREVPEVLERIFVRVMHQVWTKTLQEQRDEVRRAAFLKSATDKVHNITDACHFLGSPNRANVLKLFTMYSFPPPADRYCNMLPIYASKPESIPEEFQVYVPLIQEIEDRYGIHSGVMYLTVHESRVTDGEPQRRGGIHTDGFLAGEAPGCAHWYYWGTSMGPPPNLISGIITASTVSGSTRIWDVQIPRKESPVLSLGCDLEHLRPVLDDVAPSVMPRANEVVWLSDATPHESVPLPPGTYRQFFRLVVGEISAWWKAHSTENPIVPPNAPIIEHSKFESGAYKKLVMPPTGLQIYRPYAKDTNTFCCCMQ